MNMKPKTKFAAVLAGVLTAAFIAVVLIALYVFLAPLDPTRLMASLPAGIAASTGGALGAYLSTRQRADERETLILHQAGMYGWLFLFIALPFIALYSIYSPSPYGLRDALGLYAAWIIGIIIFSVTALYRNYR